MSVSVQQKNQLVYLSSKYATKNNTTKNSDVVFRLSRAIHKPKDTNLCVKVQQFLFPVSFYNVNSTNNTLEYYVDDVAQTDITIPEGNYTSATLTAELETQLGGDFSVSYDEETMKFHIAHDSLQFLFIKESTCFSLLGLTEGQDHQSDLILFILISEYPVNLTYTNCLYISIPNLSINNLNGNTGQRTPVIACIPIDVEAGEIVVYTNDAGLSSYTQEEIINEFHLRIYDEDQTTLIDFVNQDWFMTLQIDFEPI